MRHGDKDRHCSLCFLDPDALGCFEDDELIEECKKRGMVAFRPDVCDHDGYQAYVYWSSDDRHCCHICHADNY